MECKNSKKIKQHMEEIMRGNPSDLEVIQFCTQNYIKVFQQVKLLENAKEVIHRLVEKGNEIYLITARGDNLDFFKGSEKITREFLANNNISYTKILFNSTNKAQICKENHIDLMIDDSITHCQEVSKAGIKSILFTSTVNKNRETTVERADNWLQLEEKISMLKLTK